MPEPGNRPYKNKTIAELVHQFNEQCLAKRRLGNQGATLTFKGGKHDPELPSSFLKDPASESEIEALDQKIRKEPYNFSDGLPSDYIEFLKITNGIYAWDQSSSNSEIFRPVSEVELLELEDSGVGVELLPMIDIAIDVEVEWPEYPWGIQLGAGGDEGEHHIIDPATIAKAVQALDQAYKGASKDDKKKIDDAVKKAYGSWSALRKLKCVIFRMYHWDAEIEIFSSFKHLLEDFVQKMDDCKDEDEDDDDGNDDNDADDAGDDDGESGDNAKPRPSKQKKKIPEGKPDVLKGKKLMFTGTFDGMDRKTCKSIVKKYGGEIVTKLENSDYVVLGVNPGPKKIETIISKKMATIDEEGFFQLLKGETPHQVQADLYKKGNDRKKLPEGTNANSLNGLKLLFTGTLAMMDRATAKKMAEEHGAKVIMKLEDTDFVVLGTNAGPKKIEEIEKKGLKTLHESEFLDMLLGGLGEAHDIGGDNDDDDNDDDDSDDDDDDDDNEDDVDKKTSGEVKKSSSSVETGKRTKDQNPPVERRTSKRLRGN